MPCYSPIQVKWSFEKGDLVFASNLSEKKDFSLHSCGFKIPCRNCVGCRLEHSRQWAMRCTHEAQLHSDNCFITLTYDNAHLPSDFSLNKKHFQHFMMRYRKKFGSNIRYFHCGEYGSEFGRPHYHACIFNHDFSDKILFKESFGEKLYTSEALSQLWPFGYSTVGSLTFKSAAYVARYCMKKKNGIQAKTYYSFVDPFTGRTYQRQPDYATMSRSPGLGHDWYKKYSSDVYPSDYVVFNGRKCKPPRYYDKLFEADDPSGFQVIKAKRIERMEDDPDSTEERLLVREKCQELRLKSLGRSLDDEFQLDVDELLSDPYSYFDPEMPQCFRDTLNP